MAAFSFQESLGHCVRGKVGQIFADLPQLSPDRFFLRYANDQFADTLLPAQLRTQACSPQTVHAWPQWAGCLSDSEFIALIAKMH
jgi:hypothetical protein